MRQFTTENIEEVQPGTISYLGNRGRSHCTVCMFPYWALAADLGVAADPAYPRP